MHGEGHMENSLETTVCEVICGYRRDDVLHTGIMQFMLNTCGIFQKDFHSNLQHNHQRTIWGVSKELALAQANIIMSNKAAAKKPSPVFSEVLEDNTLQQQKCWAVFNRYISGWSLLNVALFSRFACFSQITVVTYVSKHVWSPH